MGDSQDANGQKLAPDAVDKLRKRVVTSQNKIESVTSAAKPQWEVEVDNLNKKIGDDNATIEKLLKRRLYIRSCFPSCAVHLAYVECLGQDSVYGTNSLGLIAVLPSCTTYSKNWLSKNECMKKIWRETGKT